MVKVEIKRKSHDIQEVTIRGHAGSGQHGYDLVCAGVSCISVGALNALEQLCPKQCELQMQEAYVHILVNMQSPIVQSVLATMCIQLATMQQSYKTYIKINDQEV